MLRPLPAKCIRRTYSPSPPHPSRSWVYTATRLVGLAALRFPIPVLLEFIIIDQASGILARMERRP